MALQINILEYEEGLLILQSVAHLYGSRLVGSLALIESVEEVQEHIL